MEEQTKYDEIRVKLGSRLRKTGRHPFLFVGSGIPMRYAELPNWESLLRGICARISDNPFALERYDNEVSGTGKFERYPAIATLMEKDFNRTALADPSFEGFRNEHFDQLKAGTSAFKLFIARYLDTYEPTLLHEELSVLRAASNKISGVITTNYDRFIEGLFPGFKTYAGQSELLLSDIYEVGEIYKIHGSVDNPDSIVITSSDYDSFNTRKAYLVAKILTVFVEYPIVFMGYSMNDKNILNILESLAECLGPEGLGKLRDRMIFVQHGSDVGITYTRQSFGSEASIEMTTITSDDFTPIYQAIAKSETLYPPRLMRTLKKKIFQMDLSTHGTVTTRGFDGISSLPEDAKIIIGIGADTTSKGSPVKANDIYLDAVFDNMNLNPRLVVEQYLPDLLKHNTGGLPIFKYLEVYEGELYDKVPEFAKNHTAIDSYLNSAYRSQKKSFRKQLDVKTVSAIIEMERTSENKPDSLYRKLCFLEIEEYDIDSLETLLKTDIGNNPRIFNDCPEIKRLIRIYDFLKHGSAPDTVTTSANT